MNFTTENILLIGSILIFCAIFISKAGYRFGIPALLIFLIVGMLFGSDGLGFIFDNYQQAQFLGTAALSVILLTGGMESKFKNIRPVVAQGITLSTLGVLLTSLFTGIFIFAISRALNVNPQLSLVSSFLLAAVMSSTDSAAVFSIMRDNRIKLKENLQAILELESGSNDPMAYCITIILIDIVRLIYPEANMEEATTIIPSQSLRFGAVFIVAITKFLMQLGIGSILGIAIGYAATWLFNKIKLNNTALQSTLILSLAFFTISITGMLKGNAYLAVYIVGLILGNTAFPNKKDTFKFLDGMTYLMQTMMFLSLGLLVNPLEMVKIAPLALLIGTFLIFVGRPVSVFLCLLPFKDISFKAKSFISWVGLKGAAPILFATYPVVANIQGSNHIFNIVFFITLLSVTIQGMSLSKVAKMLDLAIPKGKKTNTFGIEIPEEAGKLINCTIEENDLRCGRTLKEISLPEGARVVMIKRNEQLLVPNGSLQLQEKDELLIIMDEQQTNEKDEE